MPKACIYAGFRHLFYQMALFENGVMIGKIERTGIRRRLPCNMPES